VKKVTIICENKFVQKLYKLYQFKFPFKTLGGNKRKEILFCINNSHCLFTPRLSYWCKQRHRLETWDEDIRERQKHLS